MSKEGNNASSQSAELKNMEEGENHFGSFDVVQQNVENNVLNNMEKEENDDGDVIQQAEIEDNVLNQFPHQENIDPTSNFTAQQHYVSTAQSFAQNPQNPLGDRTGSIPMAQGADNPPFSSGPVIQNSTAREILEMIQSQGLLGSYPPTQQGHQSIDHLPIQNTEDPSPQRNVRMRMTLPDNMLFSTAALYIENPNLPRPRINLCYDPLYVEMGYPIDPLVRLLARWKSNQGNNS